MNGGVHLILSPPTSTITPPISITLAHPKTISSKVMHMHLHKTSF
jgi:hypothetical protein